MELQTGSELHIGAETRTGRVLQTESDLERLVRRYQEMLLRYCTGILGNREDAEDAVQTAFIKAWKKRNSLKTLRPDIVRFPVWASGPARSSSCPRRLGSLTARNC